MNDRTEPSADLRRAANTLWQMFCALMQEGFSEEQALKIVGYAMSGRKPD